MELAALRHRIPRGAREVMERIHSSGGRAFLVGGCLRDLLRGEEPKDWDIATDLPPDRIRPLFRRVIDVGAAFGTLIVPRPDGPYEVTTLRTESGYTDGRHPDQIAYTDQITLDLQRRDFTINAMAWEIGREAIIDPFAGRADLSAGLIRAVGDPAERFREDALRLLRAVRLAAQLDFRIEERTWRAIRREAEGLRRISAERIREELNRILLSRTPSRALLQLDEAGLLAIFLPELAACRGVRQNRFHSHDVLMHSLLAVDAAPPKLVVRLAALLHDIAKPETRNEKDGDFTFYAHQVIGARKVDRILRRLCYSNEERERTRHLVYHHMFYYEPEWTDSAVRRFVRTVGLENIPDLINLRIADMAGNARKSGSTAPLEALLKRVDDVIAKDTALSVKDLAIGGRELMAIGVPEGPGIGRILRALLERVLDDPSVNEPETLLAAARELMDPPAVPDSDAAAAPPPAEGA